MIDLKECPFCGKPVQFNYNLELTPDGVVCMNCHMIAKYTRIKCKNTDPFEVPMKQIAERWNRREG